jgi:hypothetical protein
MRTTTYLLALAVAVFATLFVADDAAAQTCFSCNDTYWTTIHCDGADWTETGGTQCEVDYTEDDPHVGPICIISGELCWGPDPEEEQLPAPALALNGTWLSPGLRQEDAATSALAGAARVYMRTCKDIIAARFYGDEARAEIEAKVRLIEI